MFQIGDKVRVKSLAWYNKNKNLKTGNIEIGPIFIERMSYFCGRIFTIRDINRFSKCIYLKENTDYSWHEDFFETANPQLEFDFINELNTSK